MYSKQAEKHKEKAIKLISIDSLGRVIVHSEALDFMKTISKPIAIISIAGPFRTGKSSFLNALLSTKSFHVSQTTNACTKGIWIWCSPILAENEAGQITNVLFIDSEGFNNFNENHDKRLIVLTLLISTSFLYNSKGTIDKDSLNDLEYVIEIAKKLRKNTFMKSNPQFFWLLRDFHLELVDELGQTITQKQYMEKCLCMSKNNLSMALLETLDSFFSTRECFAFIKPFSEIDDESSPEFINQIIQFKKKLYKIKTTATIDGNALAQIIQTYVNSMNEDDEATTMLKEGENCQLRLECLQKIEDEVSRCVVESEVREIASEKESLYKKKMYSQKQILYLSKEVENLVSKQTQQIRNSFGVIESHKNLRRNKKFEERKIRFSLNIRDLEEDVDDPILKTFSKIENDTTIQKMHEDLEAKLYRLKLQLEASQNEVFLLKEENTKLNEEKTRIEDELCEENIKWRQKQGNYINEIVKQKDLMEEAKKNSIIQNSNLNRENNLKNQKISYLQDKIKSYQKQKVEYLESLDTKYKEKIAYLTKQNEELNFKHESQVLELKKIYKIEEVDDKQQIGSPTSKSIKFDCEMYSELKEKVLEIEKLKNENEQLRMKLVEEQKQLQIRNEQIVLMENQKKEANEVIIRKKKSDTEQIQIIFKEKLNNKEKIIDELQSKVQELQKEEKEKLQVLLQKENQFSQQFDKLYQDYEEEICLLKKENIELNKKMQTYLEEMDMKEKMMKFQAIKFDEVQNKVSEKDKQISQVHKKLKTMQHQYEQEVVEKENMIEELKDEIRTLENDLNKEKNQNNQSLNSMRNMMKMESQRQEQKIEQLSKHLSEKKQLEKQIQQIKLSIQRQTNEREQYEENFKEEKAKLQLELATLKLNNEHLERENRKLESNIGELTSAINSNYNNLDQFIRMDSQKNQQKIEELIKKLNEKDKQLYKLVELASESKKLVVVLENENKKIKKEMCQIEKGDKHKEQILGLRKKNEEMGRQNGELKKQFQLLKQKSQFQLVYNKKMEEEMKRSYESDKAHSTKKIAKLERKTEDLEREKTKLNEIIDILEKDRKETSLAIHEMRKNYEKNCNQYENNARMIRDKYKLLKEENQELKEKAQQLKKQYSHLEEMNKLVSSNYQNDFKLWGKKIAEYEQIILRKTSA